MNKVIATCSKCGKVKPIVNKKYNLCSTCNRKRLQNERGEGSKPRSHSRNGKVPSKGKSPLKRISDTRRKYNAFYEKNKKDKRDYLKRENKYRCFFCNAPLEDDDIVDWHHSIGRVDTLLYEFDNINPCHRVCHTQYHSDKTSILIKRKWYIHFLERIERIARISGNKIFIKLHNKEANRLFKAGIYDQETYFNKLI